VLDALQADANAAPLLELLTRVATNADQMKRGTTTGVKYKDHDLAKKRAMAVYCQLAFSVNQKCSLLQVLNSCAMRLDLDALERAFFSMGSFFFFLLQRAEYLTLAFAGYTMNPNYYKKHERKYVNIAVAKFETAAAAADSRLLVSMDNIHNKFVQTKIRLLFT
jgi:hypothetical protein